jgi:ribosomal 50S subunit-recycling heat shock protein
VTDDSGERRGGQPGVRLDLFLRNTGLVKRRPVAHDACEAGRVLLDGKAARSGARVRTGQMLVLDLPWRRFEAEILRVPLRAVPRGDRDKCFRILRDEAVTGAEDEMIA